MGALDGSGIIFPEISRVDAGTFLSDGNGTGEPDLTLKMPKRVDGFHFRIFSNQDINVRLDAMIGGIMRDNVITLPVAANDPVMWDPMPTFKRLGLLDEAGTYRIALIQTLTTTAVIEQVIEVDD